MSESNLQETKGKFKVVGIVTRIDKDGAYKEEEMKKPNNKNNGKIFRSIKFGVRTSPTNEITVSTFDYMPDKVFLWNSEKRKNDSNYKGEKIPYSDYQAKKDKLREDGYAVLQSRVGLEYGKDGKLVSMGMPRYDASQYIFNNLNNGDSVVIEGTTRLNSYVKDGKTIQTTNYTIEKVHRVKDIDFEADDFEEISYFEQEMVFVDAEVDKKENKVFVTGRVIDYNKKFQDTEFVIDYNGPDGEQDKDMVKLATAFMKKMSFGDLLEVFGNTLNKTIVEESDDDDDSEENDDLLSDLGGKSKPSHAQKFVNRTYITEKQIHGVESWEKKFYKEDDFVVDDLVEEDDKDDLGGKSNPFKAKDEDDPFGSDEISDDDLPF